jgi:tetratricopeptide (TPR) repeat protein
MRDDFSIPCVRARPRVAAQRRGRIETLTALVQIVLLVLSFTGAATALAQDGGVDIGERRRSFTPGELALLPEYCRYQQGMPGRDTPRGRYYVASLGSALDDIHHYCRGLRDMMFARTLSLRADHKRDLWLRATQEIDYVIGKNPPTLVLMPELYYRRGEAMIELGQLNDAQISFEKSRGLKPDYWPAYTRWADYLIDVKRTADARALIEEGLKHAPDNPELKQRMARLSGVKTP